MALIACFVALAVGRLPLAMAALFGVALLVAAVRRPIYLLGITLVTTIVSIDLTGQTFVTPYKLSLLLLLVVTAMVLARRRSLLTMPVDTLVLLTIVMTGMVLGDLLAGHGMPVLFEIAGVYILIFAASQLIHSHRQVIELGGLAFVGTLFTGVWCVIEKPPWTLAGGIVRADGPSGDPNSSAMMQLLMMFLALPWLARARPLPRSVGLVVMSAATLYGVFATASRGATVAGVVGLAAFALAAPRRISGATRNVVAMTVLLATVAIVAPSSFTARMNSTVQTDEAGNTVVEDSARGVINALALRMIERAPVLGHGTGAFERESAHVIGLPFVVHNAPLRVAVSYGVPLAILFLMIYVTPLFRAVQLMLIPNDVPPVMVAALVGGTVTVLAFIQTNPRLFRVLYIFIGMLLTLLYQRAVATKRARGARPDGTTTAAERGPIASASASAALPGRG